VGCTQSNPTTLTAQPIAPVELAYVLNDQVMVYDADTNQHLAVTVEQSSTATNATSQPVLFGSGNALMFVQTVGAATSQPYYELWKYDLLVQTGELLATHQAWPHRLRISPNSQFVTYLVDDVLYLTDLKAATTTRLHEGATDSAWSPNSRRVVYTSSDQRIIGREFNVDGGLTDPETLLEQAASTPLFSSNQQLLFAGQDDTEYTILAYNLNTAAVTPVTSLRFATPPTQATLRLDDTGERILYTRSSDAAAASTVWLIYLEKDIAKPLVEVVSGGVWSNNEDEIYYQTLEPAAIWASPVTGLSHTIFVASASAITTPLTLGSNEFAP
jgi:hypothetical protein